MTYDFQRAMIDAREHFENKAEALSREIASGKYRGASLAALISQRDRMWKAADRAQNILLGPPIDHEATEEVQG